MMGFCGLNCSECRAYKGTLNPDIALLEQVARDWSNKERTYRAADTICLGCWQKDSRLLNSFCATCPVRTCALERGISVCPICPEFDACAKFETLATLDPDNDPAIAVKMKLMRAKVLGS